MDGWLFLIIGLVYGGFAVADLGFGFSRWLCREWDLGCGRFAGMVVVGLGLSAWICRDGGSCGG